MSKPVSIFAAVMASVRRQMPAVIFISCFVNLLLLVTSIYMLQIYDRVLSSGSLDTLLWLTVIAGVAIAIYGILEQSRRLILARAAGHIDRELSAPVLRHSMEKRLAGETANAGVRDVSDLRNFYQTDAILAFFDAPWSAVFIAFVWLLHPVLGMIALSGAIVLFCATLLNDLLTRNRQKEAAQALKTANEAAIRYVEGGETISPLGMAGAIFDRWKLWKDRARSEQSMLGERTTTILSFTRSLRMGLQIAVLGTGAYFVLAGELTAGAMIAASIVVSRALAPIERLTAAWNKYVAAKTAKVALGAMFSGISGDNEAVELPRPKGALSIEEVTVFAPGTRQALLQNVNFKLKPGEICAVIGPSGAGKSSLCRAIVGAWKPSVGNVRLDGSDTYAWESEELGKYLGYLPQKVELFPGTVAQNIARFQDFESAEVIKATRLAGAEELVLRLPNGFETDVGPHGDRISLGQRQRIGLARALYGNPALVVLDEPNSNLDAEGDRALVAALERLKKLNATVVIVSHRSQVLKTVDKILVLRDGAVVDFRDRDELLKPVAQSADKQRRTTQQAPDVDGKKSPLRRITVNPAE